MPLPMTQIRARLSLGNHTASPWSLHIELQHDSKAVSVAPHASGRHGLAGRGVVGRHLRRSKMAHT